MGLCLGGVETRVFDVFNVSDIETFRESEITYFIFEFYCVDLNSASFLLHGAQTSSPCSKSPISVSSDTVEDNKHSEGECEQGAKQSQ